MLAISPQQSSLFWMSSHSTSRNIIGKEESTVATSSNNSGCSQFFYTDCIECHVSTQQQVPAPPQYRADSANCYSRICEMVGKGVSVGGKVMETPSSRCNV